MQTNTYTTKQATNICTYILLSIHHPNMVILSHSAIRRFLEPDEYSPSRRKYNAQIQFNIIHPSTSSSAITTTSGVTTNFFLGGVNKFS